MKTIFFTALFLAASMTIFGQTRSTVSAILFDNGQVVSNAKIRLVSPTEVFDTTTDASGRYLFSDIPDGQYLLVYGTKQASVIVRDGKVSMAELGEVVVISSRDAETIQQVSKTVDTIEGQEMRDRADFSLVETLRSIPGFRVQQSGGFGKVAAIKTRGLRNQDTALLIDGIRFRDPTAITGDASPFLADLTLTSVRKIEILRGSGSSLYGTNAIGGVIDFQTPSARSGTHGQMSGAFGGLGLGRVRGNLSHGVPSGRFGVNAGIGRTVYTRGVDGDDRAENTNFHARVDGRPSDRTDMSGRIFVSDANVRLNISPDTFGALPALNSTIISAQPYITFVPDVNDPDSFQASKALSTQLVVNHAFSTRVVLSGFYQYLKTERRNENGSLGAGFQSASTSTFDGSINTANLEMKWIQNEIGQAKFGYEFERESYRNDGYTPSGADTYFVRGGQTGQAVFVQQRIRALDDRIQFAGGIRYQKYSLERPGFSLTNAPYSDLTLSDPPAALTFDAAASYFHRASDTKVRIHLGNGYRVPSLYERFGSFYSSFGTPSFTAIGDPFLEPEKSLAFDAGIERAAASGRVKLSATYFYTRLRDIIGYGNVVPNIGSTSRPFGGYENQKGGISRGGEFSAKANVSARTTLFGSYTFTNSDQLTPQVSGSGITRTIGIPVHQLTLVATHRIERFWVNFDFLATSSYLAPIFSNSTFNTYVYRFEGNRRGDLTAGYTFALRREGMNIRVFGTVENIFDQEYYENGFRSAKANARLGISYSF